MDDNDDDSDEESEEDVETVDLGMYGALGCHDNLDGSW